MEATNTQIRVLIADDSTLIRRLLMQQLARESDFSVVGEAVNGQDAVRLALEIKPDIVLMDLEMPVLDGIQATEQIRSRDSQIAVVLITGHENLKPLGKMTGAAYTVTKNCTPSELLIVLRNVYETKLITPLEPNDDKVRAVIERLSTEFRLSKRERAVMEKMVGTTNTAAQIAVLLSGEWMKPVTESSVKHTHERTMDKLQIEPRTRTALVQYVMGLKPTS
jgi:DNA-binding NarL/FixJ family response regulator